MASKKDKEYLDLIQELQKCKGIRCFDYCNTE